ncbi:hypothetical protein KAU37_06955 [Candidatus Bipolaricaulota bacterium]|nr:hypothetical protein [Candidatus Bipolaricaulota bacterium]
MKPNEKYKNLRERAFYNPVWAHFQTLLARVFSSVDISHTKELDRKLYVAVGAPNINQFPREFRKDVERLRADGIGIGDNEKELMDFLVLDEPEAPLFLVADVGTGKTTIINHFFRFVLGETEVGKNSETILIDANQYAAKIVSGEMTVEDAVVENIAFKMSKYLDTDYKTAFWDFAINKVKCFARIADFIAEIRSAITDKHESQRFVVDVRRGFAEAEPLQYWQANLIFLHISRKTNIQVVIDNIDVLPLPMQQEAVALAHSLTHIDPEVFELLPEEKKSFVARGLKCIVALRPPARVNLWKKLRARMDLFGSIKPPSTSDLIKKRINYVMEDEETTRLLKDLHRQHLVHEGRRYKHTDIERTLDCLHTSLLNEYALHALEALSNQNMRTAIALAGRFLRSHAIPDRHLAPTLFSQYIDASLPSHLFTRCLILGSSALYWEQGFGSLVDIVNVFTAPVHPGETTELAQLVVAPYRLLSYLSKNTDRENPIPLHALQSFNRIYPALDLDALLKKWIHFGLVQSPEVCVYSAYDEFCKNLSIAPAGTFYLTDLIHSLSYLQCIKDDCDLGEKHISTINETIHSVSDSASAVLDFYEWLAEKEEQETSAIAAASEGVRYTFAHFADAEPCVSYRILGSLAKELSLIADKEPAVEGQAKRALALAKEAEALKNHIHTTIWHIKP